MEVLIQFGNYVEQIWKRVGKDMETMRNGSGNNEERKLRQYRKDMEMIWKGSGMDGGKIWKEVYLYGNDVETI